MMRKLRDNQRALRIASGFAAFVLWLTLHGQITGQSGRRAPKTLPVTASAETTSTNPETKVAEPGKTLNELAHKVKLLVARQSTSKHLPSEDLIYASFIKRLNEFTNVSGTIIGDLKREQAAKRAQTENDSFVVLVQFEIDNYQAGKIVIDSPDLEVKYFVFAPRTGQPQLKGKIYYQAIGGAHGRKDTWPIGSPIKITVEAAGVEAAERLYVWLAEAVGTKQNK